MAYELLIRFEDQSPSFVYGFEAGRIYQAMAEHRYKIEETVHTINTDLFAQMAMRQGYEIHLAPLDDDWMTITAKRVYDHSEQE